MRFAAAVSSVAALFVIDGGVSAVSPGSTLGGTASPNAYGSWQQPPESRVMIEEPLPEGWTEYFDEQSGQPYYHYAPDGTTTWDRPKRTEVSSNATDAADNPTPDADQVAIEPSTEEPQEQPPVGSATPLPDASPGTNVLTDFQRSEADIQAEETWRRHNGWTRDSTPASEAPKPESEATAPAAWNLPPKSPNPWGVPNREEDVAPKDSASKPYQANTPGMPARTEPFQAVSGQQHHYPRQPPHGQPNNQPQYPMHPQQMRDPRLSPQQHANPQQHRPRSPVPQQYDSRSPLPAMDGRQTPGMPPRNSTSQHVPQQAQDPRAMTSAASAQPGYPPQAPPNHPHAPQQYPQQPGQQYPFQYPNPQYPGYYTPPGSGYGINQQQVVPVEEPSAVRDMVDGVWKGFLGFRNRTTEAVGSARETIGESGRGMEDDI